jgi:hypothetical protein
MSDLTVILDNIRSMVIYPVFVGLSVIMFMWAGILFLTASGDPAKIDKAKKAVIWGVVGIFVVFLAYSVNSFIKSILGIK